MEEKRASEITEIVLNRATFRGAEVKELSFVNFFFGGNGTGKSTIARALEERDGIKYAPIKDVGLCSILVFDQVFIERNFAGHSELPGVFLLGEKSIGAERRIAELTAKYQDLAESRRTIGIEFNRAKAALEALLPDLQEKIWSEAADIRSDFDACMTGRKTKMKFADAILKEMNPARHDIRELKLLYDSANDRDAVAHSLFQKARIRPGNRLPACPMLEQVIVSSSNTPFASFLKALGGTASSWVQDGHTHFAGAASGKCPYCQQKLPLDFEQQLAEAFDAQYQNNLVQISQFQQTYKSEIADVIRRLQANLREPPGYLDLEPYRKLLKQIEGAWQINRERIEDKLRDPSRVVYLVDMDSQISEMDELIDTINRKVSTVNEAVGKRKASMDRVRFEITQYLAWRFEEDVMNYRSQTKIMEHELKQIVARGTPVREELDKVGKELAELKKRNVSMDAAIEGINAVLQETGFQGFRIRAKQGVENAFEIVRDGGIPADKLSEGERNFLAFLYFHQRVRGSLDRTCFRDKIVVIDDPVSGMDSAALHAVSAIVRNMASACRNCAQTIGVPGENIRQLFVLTHNAAFHREVSDMFVGDYDRVSFYLLQKQNNVSTVKLCKQRRDDTPSGWENWNPVPSSYAALWDDLLSMNTVSSAASVMRRILKHYFIQTCGRSEQELRMTVLQNEENRGMFLQIREDGTLDQTEWNIASFLLSGLSSSGEMEDSVPSDAKTADVGTYMKVFRNIFRVLGQENHCSLMTGTDS